MTGFRVRVAKLTKAHGAGAEYPYAIQTSEYGLVWWTVARFKEEKEATDYAVEFANFVSKNRLLKEEKVLWHTKL